MANRDLELLRLEEVLRLARERLTLIIQKVGDPAAIKAAEDLCAEAAAAIAAHRHPARATKVTAAVNRHARICFQPSAALLGAARPPAGRSRRARPAAQIQETALTARLGHIRGQLRNRIVRRIGLIDGGALRKGEVALASRGRKPQAAIVVLDQGQRP